MAAGTGGHRDTILERDSLRVLLVQRTQERKAAAERIAAARARNAARVQAAHQARMAAQWQPALTAEQLRDALAKARRSKALQGRTA